MKFQSAWILSAALAAMMAGCAAETIPLAKVSSAEVDVLTGIPWFLESYGPASSPTPLLPGTESTLLLDSETRQISGLAGCNRFTGSFALSGSKINVGALAMTKRLCVEPAGLDAQEAAVASALSSAVRYEFEDGKLVLHCGNNVLLRYTTTATPEEEAPALDSLRLHLGEYPRDIRLWRHPFLERRLKALLGDSYAAFLANMRVQGPLLEENGLLYVTGNKPHEGGANMAVFLADPVADKIQIWLAVGGKATGYSEAEPPLVDPPAVATFKSNLAAAP